jgi:hypothetical protein
MVAEVTPDYSSQSAAINAVAQKSIANDWKRERPEPLFYQHLGCSDRVPAVDVRRMAIGGSSISRTSSSLASAVDCVITLLPRRRGQERCR